MDASTAEAATGKDGSADAPHDGPPVESGTADAAHDAPVVFTPASITSKLAFWFDPTSLRQTSGGSISRWVDLTGNANDAIQSNTTYQPTYTASGINGLPSATFSAPIVFLRIADGPTMQWGTSDIAVFAVIRGRSQSANEAMIYQKTGASPYDGASLYLNADKPSTTTLAASQVSGQVYVVSASPPATFDDGSVHLLALRRSGVTLEIRVDGTVNNSIVNATVGTVDVSSAGYDGIIGQNGYGAPSTSGFQQFYGDIAEMVGVRASLTATELGNLEQYLKGRYAIP
jgi:hypothetical protein